MSYALQELTESNTGPVKKRRDMLQMRFVIYDAKVLAYLPIHFDIHVCRLDIILQYIMCVK